MQPYQRRVLDETHALGVKLLALTQFLRGAMSCDVDEHVRLIRQRDAMHAYYSILHERIASWQ